MDEKRMTLAVYMAGDADDLDPYVDRDLAEIMKGLENLGNKFVQCLVQVDRRVNKDGRIVMAFDDAAGKFKRTEELLEEEIDSGTPRSLTAFLKWVFEKTMNDNKEIEGIIHLLIWGHGSGFRIDHAADRAKAGRTSTRCLFKHLTMENKWIAFDETSLRALDVDELVPAIVKAKSEAGVTEDFSLGSICCDACLMASFEVAYELSNSPAAMPIARYLVASISPEPLDGWDYTRTIPSLGTKDQERSLLSLEDQVRAMASSYRAAYTVSSGGTQVPGDNRVTMSVVDLARAKSFGKALNEFAEKALDLVGGQVKGAKAALKSAAQDGTALGYTYNLDLLTLFEKFKEKLLDAGVLELKAFIEAVMTTLGSAQPGLPESTEATALVIQNEYIQAEDQPGSADRNGGITIWFPNSKPTRELKQVAETLKRLQVYHDFPKWPELNDTFWV